MPKASGPAELRIGLLNLMPDKVTTEKHWFNLLTPQPAKIDLLLLRTHSYLPKHISPEYLANYYTADIPNDLDGLIITGAPLGQKSLDEVLYWPELKTKLNRMRERQVPMFFSCWAANVALHSFFQIPLERRTRKLFGIFHAEPSSTASSYSAVALPHSRYAQVNQAALKANADIKIALWSQEAGATLLFDQDENFYLLAHPEYDLDTLQREYQRDRANGLSTELPEHDLVTASGAQVTAEIAPPWRQFGIDLMHEWIKKAATRSRGKQ